MTGHKSWVESRTDVVSRQSVSQVVYDDLIELLAIVAVLAMTPRVKCSNLMMPQNYFVQPGDPMKFFSPLS